MGRQVVIIGGGAAGMTAAITAARAGASVTVLEHMGRVGRKLLSTGNGRCNFSNLDQKPEYYRCTQPDFPWKVVRQFPVEQAVEFFAGLGILAKERGGYLYPNSDQASSVLQVLRTELERLGVDVRTGCQVKDVRRRDGWLAAETDAGCFYADALILAAGSKAAPVTGSDGSGYDLAQRLGHRIISPLPALVQLRCAEPFYKQLAGVRTEARVDLYVKDEGGRVDSETAKRNDKAERADVGDMRPNDRAKSHDVEVGRTDAGEWRLAASDRGELQLTDYGISGIPVFQVSRYASCALHNRGQVKAVIDFLPGQTAEETAAMLRSRADAMPEKTCEQWMCGLFNNKLSAVLLKRAGLNASRPAGEVTEAGWRALARQIRQFETVVKAANSYDHAQVCCGGVDVSEVKPESLESRKVRGLYFAGEILDVDGICGGYNLQWAWSSGAVAGCHAAEAVAPAVRR